MGTALTGYNGGIALSFNRLFLIGSSRLLMINYITLLLGASHDLKTLFPLVITSQLLVKNVVQASVRCSVGTLLFLHRRRMQHNGMHMPWKNSDDAFAHLCSVMCQLGLALSRWEWDATGKRGLNCR